MVHATPSTSEVHRTLQSSVVSAKAHVRCISSGTPVANRPWPVPSPAPTSLTHQDCSLRQFRDKVTRNCSRGHLLSIRCHTDHRALAGPVPGADSPSQLSHCVAETRCPSPGAVSRCRLAPGHAQATFGTCALLWARTPSIDFCSSCKVAGTPARSSVLARERAATRRVAQWAVSRSCAASSARLLVRESRTGRQSGVEEPIRRSCRAPAPTLPNTLVTNTLAQEMESPCRRRVGLKPAPWPRIREEAPPSGRSRCFLPFGPHFALRSLPKFSAVGGTFWNMKYEPDGTTHAFGSRSSQSD